MTSFFDKGAKAAAAKAIAAVEAQTSAEVVLAVRRSSGEYRDVDYLAGTVGGFVGLLLLLFLPQEFSVAWMPAGVAAAFGLGAALSILVPSLRRRLIGDKRLRACVRSAARASFVDRGISRTKGRTGILVFASLFEQRVEVVGDLGIIPEQLGPDYQEAVQGLERSIERGADLDALLAALERLGPALSEDLPHLADDENELSDDMEVES
jgi:putative membrane protein